MEENEEEEEEEEGKAEEEAAKETEMRLGGGERGRYGGKGHGNSLVATWSLRAPQPIGSTSTNSIGILVLP